LSMATNTSADQIAKLRLVVEVARDYWRGA
jgi:hypothetical protein